MSSYPGWDGNLPTDILPDTGALYVGANTLTPPPLIGRSKGGLSFDRGVTVTHEEFDGMRSPVVGLSRITKYDAKIKGKLVQFGHTPLGLMEPGLQSVSGSGQVSLVYFAKPASQFYQPTDYGTDLRLTFRRPAGTFVQVRFHKFLCIKYAPAGKDKTLVEFDVEFDACLDMSAVNPFTGATATLDDCPYGIEEMLAGAFP